MKKTLTIYTVIAFLFMGSAALAATWNGYGVHGGSIVESGGQITAVAGDTAGEIPDYHWNKSNWTTRTGEKDFYVTSDLNGKSVGCIATFSWNLVSGYWGNAYFNIMVKDTGGKKAILCPAYNSATSTGWDTTVGSTTKSYCVFEAEAGWTGTTATGWYAATWDEVKDLTISDGPFTEFPDTLAGDATMQNDTVYTVANWAAWADLAAGSDADWEKGGVMITFGQSTGPGANPDTTVIENLQFVVLPVNNVTQGTYHATIQAAIDAANSGDTINVAGGTYAESINIDKALTLQSTDGTSTTTIAGTGTTAVIVSADNVEINGFTITNPSGKHGIYAQDHSKITITNNIVTDVGSSDTTTSGTNFGIAIVSSASAVDSITITDNEISHVVGGNYKSADGIAIGWSNGAEPITGLVIKNNTITNVTSSIIDYSAGGRGAYGILINHGTGTTGKTVGACVCNNTISNLEGLWAHGIGLEGNTPDACVKGNRISNLIDHKSPSDAVAVQIEDNASADTLKINFNSFSNLNVGAQNVAGTTVNAESNWWGTAVLLNVPALVNGDVDYEPILLTNQINMAAGGNRLALTQNNDGGWDWPLDDANPNSGSVYNTVGPIAMGLAKAYWATGDPDILGALQKVKTFLLTKTDNFIGPDGYLAAELDTILGGTACADYVNTNFYNKLAGGTYYDARSGLTCDTATYVQAQRDRRSGTIANLAAWDVGMALVGAASAGVSGSELDTWINGVKGEIDELDGSKVYDVIGLAGAVYGLAFVGEDFDPTAGEHAAASGLADLADVLAAYQLETGGFTWNSLYMDEAEDNETIQETAYAILALQEMGGYTQAVEKAVAYLKSVQLCTGGWINSVDSTSENNEVTGEALWGLGPWNLLQLNVPDTSIYVKPAEDVITDMDVANLLQKINSCQAMLGYSSTYFNDPTGGCVAPGGGVWDLVIWDSWRDSTGTSGDIDTAIGVDAYGATGTEADGTVAVITLEALTEGVTEIVFRADDPDDETKQTILSDMASQTVWPTKINSQTIVIDGTAPTINILSAKQSGQELIGTATNAVQGTVDIQVTASDPLAGLAGPPTVTVTPQGGSAEATVFVNESPTGTFNYTWTVAAATPNGTATINASVSDNAGNNNSDSDSFNINKNQITGTVEMDTLSTESYGFSRDVVFKATDAGGSLLKTWTCSVAFTNNTGTKIAGGSYTLTDVPDGTANLSAKTAWSLRRRQSVTLDGDGQAAVDFLVSSSTDLLGADLNGTNGINILDYSVLKINWYTTNAVADINGDGEVQGLDFLILRANFFTLGDPE